jgi:hypothetical protein
MATKRRSAKDYEAMADDYGANPPRPDEILAVQVNPAALNMGRPAATPETTDRNSEADDGGLRP